MILTEPYTVALTRTILLFGLEVRILQASAILIAVSLEGFATRVTVNCDVSFLVAAGSTAKPLVFGVWSWSRLITDIASGSRRLGAFAIISFQLKRVAELSHPLTRNAYQIGYLLKGESVASP